MQHWSSALKMLDKPAVQPLSLACRYSICGRCNGAVAEASVSNPLSRVFQRQSLRDHIRRSLESGVGLYHTTWRLESDSTHMANTLIVWCREVLGQTHRPYGLDYVTLTLAVLDEDNVQQASSNCGILRPQDFYSEGAAETQIHEVLLQWTGAQVPESSRLSAVLFSWGDLTRELLLSA